MLHWLFSACLPAPTQVHPPYSLGGWDCVALVLCFETGWAHRQQAVSQEGRHFSVFISLPVFYLFIIVSFYFQLAGGR